MVFHVDFFLKPLPPSKKDKHFFTKKNPSAMPRLFQFNTTICSVMQFSSFQCDASCVIKNL